MCSRRVGTWIVLLAFGLSAAVPAPLLAQAESLDLDTPMVEHTESDRPSEGARQVFSAVVTDDETVERVLLFHRLSEDAPFERVIMNRIAGSAVFEAVVEVDPATDREIQYYIEAQDSGGNSTLQGLAFDPLVRFVAEAPPKETDGTSESRSVWWYVAGALALGALAAAASGGGDGGGSDETTSAPAGCCRIEVEFDEP